MTTKAKTESPLRMIATAIVAANPNNPRTDMGDTTELEASISAHGILQPILVRRVDGGYECVAGSRRLAAARALDLESIPCHLVDCDDERAHELAIAENVVRKDMGALDEIRAVGAMADSGDSHAEIAARFGRTPRWVSTRAKIARMPERVLELIGDGSLKVSEAEELAKLHVSHVEELAERAASGNMGLRWVREKVCEALRAIPGVPWTSGECARCILRSDKQTHLFEGELDAPARCMDSDCWAQKRDAWIAKTEKELRAKGHLPKKAYMSAYSFENHFGTITNDEEQIAELREAGIKERYSVNPDSGEILLRWDYDDLPEKTVKTASGDDIPDIAMCVHEAIEGDDEAEPQPRPESAWQRKSRERNAIAAAVMKSATVYDLHELLLLAAEALRRNIGGSRMDDLLDGEEPTGIVRKEFTSVMRALLADMVSEFYANEDSDNDDREMWREFVARAGIESFLGAEAAK